jgi:hypothetical protein
VGGPYKIRWSKTVIAEDSQENVIVLVEGEVPTNETKVTVTFDIPEASYGTNYVQYLRSYRPETPYNFTFSVLPSIKVSPSSVSPGSKVTVSGTGFPANNQLIHLSFDGKDTDLEIRSNDMGSFDAEFAIANTIAGNHEFKATVENTSIGEVSDTFRVQPKVTLNPEHPEIGAEVTLTGNGFAANSQLTIKYDDIVLPNSPPDQPLTTDNTGSFSYTFQVPESSKDNHVISATDKAGNVATFGLPLEGEAPPAPNLLYPCDGQRFGLFGPQIVTFKWEPVSDPSGITYTFEIGQSTQVWPPTVTKTGLTSTTCTVKLEPGTYFWRVKAIDGAGNESESTLSPYPFKVGLFSIWLVVGSIIVFAVIFILIVRAFFRRVREYYK